MPQCPPSWSGHTVRAGAGQVHDMRPATGPLHCAAACEVQNRTGRGQAHPAMHITALCLPSNAKARGDMLGIRFKLTLCSRLRAGRPTAAGRALHAACVTTCATQPPRCTIGASGPSATLAVTPHSVPGASRAASRCCITRQRAQASPALVKRAHVAHTVVSFASFRAGQQGKYDLIEQHSER